MINKDEQTYFKEVHYKMEDCTPEFLPFKADIFSEESKSSLDNVVSP